MVERKEGQIKKTLSQTVPDASLHTFFVLHGLWNGEEGMRATSIGDGDQYPDGWYYISADDKTCIGPFHSRNEAFQEWFMNCITND